MKYQMFEGDNDGSFFVLSCHSITGLKEAVKYYEGLGYDCSAIAFNENVPPNIIVRTLDKLLLPCGASMSAILHQRGIEFKDFKQK